MHSYEKISISCDLMILHHKICGSGMDEETHLFTTVKEGAETSETSA